MLRRVIRVRERTEKLIEIEWVGGEGPARGSQGIEDEAARSRSSRRRRQIGHPVGPGCDEACEIAEGLPVPDVEATLLGKRSESSITVAASGIKSKAARQSR